MAINDNSIELAQRFTSVLDEAFAYFSKSALLETPARVGDFIGARTVNYLKVSTDGLGDYDREGFAPGKVTAEYEPVVLQYDRGREFEIDAMDNEETQNAVFMEAASEFMRTKVIPEVDAVRFATLAGAVTPIGANLSKDTVIAAIDAAVGDLDDNEVPEEGRILFVTPTIYQYMLNSGAVQRIVETTDEVDRRFVMFDGIRVEKVPQSRFYTAIDLNDGKAAGVPAGGYAKASGAKDINFILTHPSSPLIVTKHAPIRIFSPEVNQSKDAWKYQYRIYHGAYVFDNKVGGVYVHRKA